MAAKWSLKRPVVQLLFLERMPTLRWRMTMRRMIGMIKVIFRLWWWSVNKLERKTVVRIRQSTSSSDDEGWRHLHALWIEGDAQATLSSSGARLPTSWSTWTTGCWMAPRLGSWRPGRIDEKDCVGFQASRLPDVVETSARLSVRQKYLFYRPFYLFYLIPLTFYLVR